MDGRERIRQEEPDTRRTECRSRLRARPVPWVRRSDHDDRAIEVRARNHQRSRRGLSRLSRNSLHLMSKPPRYRTALESRKPGYLAKRFAAIYRLMRMKSRSNVQPITKAKKEAA